MREAYADVKVASDCPTETNISKDSQVAEETPNVTDDVGPPASAIPPEAMEMGDDTTPARRPAAMPTHEIDMIGCSDILLSSLRALGGIFRWLLRFKRHAGGEAVAPATRFSSFDGRLSIRRWIYFGLVLATTAIAAARLWTILRIDGVTGLEGALMVAFTVLFAWIASSFWLACFGVLARWCGTPLDRLARPVRPAEAFVADRPRTALVMPVYNEDVPRVFAGLTSICESVCAAGGAKEFDVFILSDTKNQEALVAEARHFRQLREAMADGLRIYYRHRTQNKGRKSGNIADFCENWGSLYDYMVVLDADSLMTGETLRELVGLMDANPNSALIQVPPMIVGRESLFARVLQFASSVYGPIYATGLAYLQGGDGNYWGHNAIIRVKPFMENCGLPTLSGKPPLGGEIMSHDFVEAALLRRAGWEVWLAPELGGSFEETPPTAIDHLARDRRWCQGNMQHTRLILTRGLRTSSRLHLGIGIMSYLSSPLWLVLLGLLAVQAYTLSQQTPVSYIGAFPILSWSVSHVEALILLIVAMIVLLFGPKLLALIMLMRNRSLIEAHGGTGRAMLGVVCESVFSALFAPVAMLSHCWFVLSILFGWTTGWSGQQRDDHDLPLAVIARAFAAHSIIGIVLAAAVYLVIPTSFWWFSPFLIALCLAMPMAYFTRGLNVGRWTRRQGLFLIPCETVGEHVVDRAAFLANGADFGATMAAADRMAHLRRARGGRTQDKYAKAARRAGEAAGL